jgi:hypothetical protein
MIKICATFEEWYLGDGTYPPLTKGQKVNLSFYVNPTELQLSTRTDFEFKQNQYSDYSYCGRVIKTYESEENSEINIVDCGQFRFYIEGSPKIPKLKEGQFIEGRGMLLLDYYMWVENLADYSDAPDIFYNYQVDAIRKVKIPEKFIGRSGGSISHPSSLSPADYSDKDIFEISDMRTDDGRTSFYLLDLDPINEQIGKTFT